VTIAPPRWRAIVFRAARDEEGAAKVDGLNAIPLIRFDFGEWSRVEDPWLVMTMSSEPVRRNASSTIRSASSGRVTSPAARAPQHERGHRSRLPVDVGAHHLRTFGHERSAARAPDPAGCAGDELPSCPGGPSPLTIP
jgi:hypothetical protein